MRKDVRAYLDIETLPAPFEVKAAMLKAAMDAAEEEILAIKPPGKLKKQETIDEWNATERPNKVAAIRQAAEAAADEEWHKTGLSGLTGRVYCVSVAINESDVRTFAVPDDGEYGKEEEGRMLYAFAEAMDSVDDAVFAQYIGHNVQGFDLRFMFQRAVILGARLPRGFPLNSPVWEQGMPQGRVFDTMVAWAGRHGRVKLEQLCEAFGVIQKGEELGGEHIDGSMVSDYVFRGEGKKVQTYCEADVIRVREIAKRMMPVLQYCA